MAYTRCGTVRRRPKNLSRFGRTLRAGYEGPLGKHTKCRPHRPRLPLWGRKTCKTADSYAVGNGLAAVDNRHGTDRVKVLQTAILLPVWAMTCYHETPHSTDRIAHTTPASSPDNQGTLKAALNVVVAAERVFDDRKP